MANYKKRSARVRRIIMRRRIICCTVCLALILAVFFGIRSCKNPSSQNGGNGGNGGNSGVTSSNVSSGSDEPYVVSSATIGSTGDAIMHDSVLWSVEDSGYDFSGIFATVKPYYSAYDMMVMNLEVTFGTNTNYKGYPSFNCPATFADAAKWGGVDMLLTANNHSYDNGHSGFANTLTQLKNRNLLYIGSRFQNEKPYIVKDINGIKVGFVCYTYSTTSGEQKGLNGHIMSVADSKLINTFDYSRLNDFYSDAEQIIEKMKSDGADATVIYVHWGDEYAAKPNSTQKSMAQKICDMGYDVIVGSHPHVVQAIETLKSTAGHETVCAYSLGNSVSNQRKEIMSEDNHSGHTEDGMVLEIRFDKYSDGTVVLSDVNALPTWVDLRTENGQKSYNIIPLDLTKNWSDFGVSSVTEAKASYNRTLKRIGEGLNAWRTIHGKAIVPLTAN